MDLLRPRSWYDCRPPAGARLGRGNSPHPSHLRSPCRGPESAQVLARSRRWLWHVWHEEWGAPGHAPPRAPPRWMRERRRRVRPRRGPVRQGRGPVRPRRGPVRPRRGPVRPRRGRVRQRRGPVRPRRGPVRPRRGPVRPRRGPVRPRRGPVGQGRSEARRSRGDVRPSRRAARLSRFWLRKQNLATCAMFGRLRPPEMPPPGGTVWKLDLRERPPVEFPTVPRASPSRRASRARGSRPPCGTR